MKDEKIAIYKLINEEGVIVYIGQTNNVEIRLYTHTKRRPCVGNGSGKFYGLTLTIEVIEYVYTRKEAFKREEELQRLYGLNTDNENRYKWRLENPEYTIEQQAMEQSERMKKYWSSKTQEDKLKQSKILCNGRKKKQYA